MPAKNANSAPASTDPSTVPSTVPSTDPSTLPQKPPAKGKATKSEPKAKATKKTMVDDQVTPVDSPDQQQQQQPSKASAAKKAPRGKKAASAAAEVSPVSEGESGETVQKKPAEKKLGAVPMPLVKKVKEQLAGEISFKNQTELKTILETFIEVIVDTVSRGDSVTLPNVMTFKRMMRKQRTHMNPKTMDAIVKPAHYVFSMYVKAKLKKQFEAIEVEEEENKKPDTVSNEVDKSTEEKVV